MVPKLVEMHMKLKNQSGKKMATYNLNGFVWALKLKEPWLIRSLSYIKGEDVPFIQAVRPGENVDEAPIVYEQSVEIDDKSGAIDDHDPTAATESNNLLEDVDSLFKEVVDVRPDLTGRVDELRTKLVQTLTSNVSPQETQVGNTSRPTPFDDSRKLKDSKGDQSTCYYQQSQQGSLQHLLNALEAELPLDVSCLQLDNVDEPHFDATVKVNGTHHDVDNEDGKYCLDDMSIGFEEDTSNEEIKNKKVNLDRCIADVMDTENMIVAIESHSSELYQVKNMSEENVVKVNDTPSLKTGFRVVGRNRKPEFPDESEVDVEEQENWNQQSTPVNQSHLFQRFTRRHPELKMIKLQVFLLIGKQVRREERTKAENAKKYAAHFIMYAALPIEFKKIKWD
ncbi:hypothetical protein Tco_0453972 [Tanacetum coccineum]